MNLNIVRAKLYKEQSDSTAEAVRVEANLPRHPLEMRPKVNDCKRDRIRENMFEAISMAKCEVSIPATAYEIFASRMCITSRHSGVGLVKNMFIVRLIC